MGVLNCNPAAPVDQQGIGVYVSVVYVAEGLFPSTRIA